MYFIPKEHKQVFFIHFKRDSLKRKNGSLVFVLICNFFYLSLLVFNEFYCSCDWSDKCPVVRTILCFKKVLNVFTNILELSISWNFVQICIQFWAEVVLPFKKIVVEGGVGSTLQGCKNTFVLLGLTYHNIREKILSNAVQIFMGIIYFNLNGFSFKHLMVPCRWSYKIVKVFLKHL